MSPRAMPTSAKLMELAVLAHATPCHAGRAPCGEPRRQAHGRRPPSAVRGLTLLELAVVMVVLAVLSTLAVPSMASRLRSDRLLGAGEMLAADIADARHEAARRGRSLHVEASPGAGTWCWAVATSATCPCTGHNKGDGSGAATPGPDDAAALNCRLKTVPAREHPGVKLTHAEPVQLGADGHASPVLAAAFSAGERQLHVQVSRLGRTRLCDPQGQSNRVPRC